MRFLILSQYYAPEVGAPQVRLGAMARTLKSLGHEVEVMTALPNYPHGRIAPDYRGRFFLQEEIDGIKVHRIWLYAAQGAGLKRLVSYLSFAFLALIGLWRCSSPDYVFVESPPLFLSLSGFVMARLWRAQLIFNVSDLWPDSAKELALIDNTMILRLAEYLEDWSYRVSDKVTAVTEGIRQAFLDRKGVPAHKVLFLPNGVDSELFKPRARDQELSERLRLQGKRLILYAGTMGFAQGLETVLAAAGGLMTRQDLIFVFIGDGAEKEKLRALAAKASLGNVIFLEPAPLEFVARLYSLALAGLTVLRDIPLFQGARPSKMFPSMASGVPVIYSGAGEGARLIEGAQAGLIVPPENPTALAEAVVQLADNPELSRHLGQKAREYAEQHLNWQVSVGSWLGQLNGAGQ